MNDINLLKLFSSTHDFQYYDQLSTETKTLIQSIINSKHGVKTMVETIILNHTHTSPPPIRRVIGPMSLEVITLNQNGGEKKFYLFGDVHTQPKCPSGTVFGVALLNHLSKLDKIVDVFYEQIHLQVKLGSFVTIKDDQTQRINALVVASKNCVYFNESKDNPCEYKNIRFHQADIRLTLGSLTFHLTHIATMKSIYLQTREIEQKTHQEIMDVLMQPFRNALNFLIQIPAKDRLNFVSEDLAIKRTKKQIDHIKDQNIKEYLSNSLNMYINSILPILDTLSSVFYTVKPRRNGAITRLQNGFYRTFDLLVNEKSDEELTQDLYNRFGTIATNDVKDCVLFLRFFGIVKQFNSVSLLDLYFLGRCFRSFDTVKNNIPKDPCKNIVGYFGDSHIRDISSILLHEPFNGTSIKTMRTKRGDIDFQCLDLEINGNMF